MARNRQLNRDKKRLNVTNDKYTIYGNKDLTPYNVNKKEVKYK